MSLANTLLPFQNYTDTLGKPISSGKVYIGAVDQDPETNPVTVYSDSAGTITLSQPLKIVNGYIVNNAGTPIQVFVNADYSIRVYSKNAVVYYFPEILAKSIDGPAGGSLAGSYPNPTLAALSVNTAQLVDQSVVNAKLKAGTNNTIKGTTASAVADLTGTQVTAMLDSFTPSTNVAVGKKGLVPATAIGDQLLDKVLQTTGLWDFLNLTTQKLVVQSDANGYFVVLGNVMYCWGYKAGIVADTTAVATFPNGGFANANYGFGLTPIYAYDPAHEAIAQLDSSAGKAATGLTIRNKNVQNNPVIDVQWWALGQK
jgi:hypothetical protein